jgi:hypothetical protein
VDGTLQHMNLHSLVDWRKDARLVMMYKIANNEADHHDITEILLKMALNTIKQTNNKIANKNVAITKNDLLELIDFAFMKRSSCS